jgi:hypothetical protein
VKSIFTYNRFFSKQNEANHKLTPVIEDIACLDIFENSCLNNCVEPKSKDTDTQAHGKFVLTCHNCGKVGHIRPNYFLLKTTDLGLSRMLRGKVKLKNLPHPNMSLHIGVI